MPVADPDTYAAMLDRARAGGFAYPAINVSSSETLHGALRGFAEAESDGIVEVSTGGAAYLSGATVGDLATGATALAEFAHVVAAKYPATIALHTDHCPPDHLDDYVRPLLRASQDRVAAGGLPLFGSHMWDGSALPLEENLRVATELLAECRRAHVVLELEIGVVGGEEDGITGAANGKLYSTPDDAWAVAERLGLGERGRYLLAATFGNVHGVYQPGHVQLRPAILKEIQDVVGNRSGRTQPFDLVFHGGSGSSLTEVREAVGFGVRKMNLDTDLQYAYTRAVAGHVFRNYDGVLRVDGDVGRKSAYDPRVYGRLGEASMAERVARSCRELGSAGHRVAAAATG